LIRKCLRDEVYFERFVPYLVEYWTIFESPSVEPVLAAIVEVGLEQRCSPAQIAHRLRVDHPDDESLRVSHETIYRSLYLQGRGGLRRELIGALRTGRVRRRPRTPGEKAKRANVLGRIVPISERPPEAADRAVPGHWESQCCCQAAMAMFVGAGSV
jgi:transposase, IS30 family